MPEATELETVTRQQRIWANLILVEGGFAPEPEEEEPTEPFPEGGVDRFGDGSKKTVLPYGTSIPQEFKKALEKGAGMLSADGWKNVQEGRKSQFLKNLEALTAKKAELAVIEQRVTALDDDLEYTDEYYAGLDRIRQLKLNIDSLEEPLKPESPLVILESPGNNPESLEVSQRLEGFAEFEKAFADKKGDKEEFQKYVSEKARRLYGLQATVFKWIDRRTQQNLQPSADAVALADIIQRVHLEMMEEVIKNGLPMPLSEENEAKLSAEEKAIIQQTWKDLVESQQKNPANGSQLSVKAPPGNEYLRNDEDREQFRIETLANLSRLLQIPTGRKLLAAINQGEHSVNFTAGEEDGCGPTVEKNALEQEDAMEEGGTKRAPGSSSTVFMVLGQKDSDNLLSTATGGVLFCPSFIAVGHELVHALHNSQGRNQRKLPMGKLDPLWNNREEYQTIFKGKVSEQTLRQEYGLSAERFGHSDHDFQAPVEEAVANLLKAENELMELKPEIVDKKLSDAGFPPETTATMVNELKLKLFHSDLKGPVPEGWELSQLTFEQLAEILAPKPLPSRLHEFGWKPYGLDRARMEEIYRSKEHHPRSEKGLRMRALGGQDALKAFDRFNAFGVETDCTLKPSTGETWEDDLAALEAADQILVGLSKNYKGEDVQTAAVKGTKLQKRINNLVTELTYAQMMFNNEGGEEAFAAIAECQQLFGGEKFPMDRSSFSTKRKSIQVANGWLTKKIDDLSDAEFEKVKGSVGERLRIVAELYAPKMEKEFAEFGGEDGFKAVIDIMFLTGAPHETDFGDSLSSKIAECKAAQAALDAYVSRYAPDRVKSIVESSVPLHKKLKLIEEAEAAAQSQEQT